MTNLVPARSDRQVALRLLTTLLNRNLKTRNRGSVLGLFWHLFNPPVQLVLHVKGESSRQRNGEYSSSSWDNWVSAR